MGISAVANIGTASVIHQIIIQLAAAITFQASASIGRGLGIISMIIKHNGPTNRP